MQSMQVNLLLGEGPVARVVMTRVVQKYILGDEDVPKWELERAGKLGVERLTEEQLFDKISATKPTRRLRKDTDSWRTQNKEVIDLFRKIASPFPKGRTMLEILSLRIDKKPVDLCGILTENDGGFDRRFRIEKWYSCPHRRIESYEAFLKGPDQAIWAGDFFYMHLDHYGSRSYVIMRNAAQASVEVILIKRGAGEHPTNVFGSITAKSTLDEIKLFRRSANDCIRVSQEDAIPLSRSVLVAPRGFYLKIHADVRDREPDKPSYEVAGGDVDFLPDIQKLTIETLKGKWGEIKVRVSWR